MGRWAGSEFVEGNRFRFRRISWGLWFTMSRVLGVMF